MIAGGIEIKDLNALKKMGCWGVDLNSKLEDTPGIKNHELLRPYLEQKIVQQLINISAGWYRIEEKDGKLLFWDLRFGQMGMDVNNASFLWYYELNIDSNGRVSAKKTQPRITNFKEIFLSLFNRIKGN